MKTELRDTRMMNALGDVERSLTELTSLIQNLASTVTQIAEEMGITKWPYTDACFVADTVVCDETQELVTNTPVLRHWQIRKAQAYGMVLSHPRFPDGTWVRTSRVVKCNGQCLVTLHRRYRLQCPKHPQ